MGAGENVREVILLLLAEGEGEKALAYVGTPAKRDYERESSGHTPFWTLYRPVTEILHCLEVGPEELAQNAGSILEASPGDMMGGQLYGTVVRMARQSEEHATKAYETLISHPGSPVTSLASRALVGLATTDFASTHRQAL